MLFDGNYLRITGARPFQLPSAVEINGACGTSLRVLAPVPITKNHPNRWESAFKKLADYGCSSISTADGS